MDCLIWLVIPGHQKHSRNKDRVWSWPWCPASLRHPFRAATQCAFGTMKTRRSSFSPLDIECRYKAFWWIVKFYRFGKISHPSSLKACSARSAFNSIFICTSNQSQTTLSTGSSFWTSVQSVSSICTSAQPVATCTSCSKPWSPLTMVGSWTSTQCTAPRVTQSRIDLTVSGSRFIVTWLNKSATVLSYPFWYSNWKLNLARALTHQWPVALTLGVIIM